MFINDDLILETFSDDSIINRTYRSKIMSHYGFFTALFLFRNSIELMTFLQLYSITQLKLNLEYIFG